MEKEYKELGTAIKKREVPAKTKELEEDLKKRQNKDKLLLIFHLLLLILKITTDSFPFDLYYVELYDRYRKVRYSAVHIRIHTMMRNALCKLDEILTSVVAACEIAGQ